jgi:hypothetical protein
VTKQVDAQLGISGRELLHPFQQWGNADRGHSLCELPHVGIREGFEDVRKHTGVVAHHGRPVSAKGQNLIPCGALGSSGLGVRRKSVTPAEKRMYSSRAASAVVHHPCEKMKTSRKLGRAVRIDDRTPWFVQVPLLSKVKIVYAIYLTSAALSED